MHRLQGFAVAALAAVSLFAGSASAQNLVTNGSFEAGIAGWTVSSGACPWDSLAAGGASTGAGNFVAPAPTDGARVLVSDAVMIETCTFQQDVAIPAGATAQLSLDAGYFYRDFGDPTGAGCTASVDVTTTAGVPIVNVYAAAGGANQALAARPAVDLSAQAGTTVRILVSTTSCVGGPAGVVLDNVVLAAAAATPTSVPTLSEWAMILMGLLMAAAAATRLRARDAA